jgi:hypothetical protein
MKRYPKCERTCTNLSLSFCLDDGTPLMSELLRSGSDAEREPTSTRFAHRVHSRLLRREIRPRHRCADRLWGDAPAVRSTEDSIHRKQLDIDVIGRIVAAITGSLAAHITAMSPVVGLSLRIPSVFIKKIVTDVR